MRTHKQTNERRNLLNQQLNAEVDSLIKELALGVEPVKPDVIRNRQNYIEMLRIRIQEVDWQLGIETVIKL